MTFSKFLEEQQFDKALAVFEKMKQSEKEETLKQLHYEARNAKTPVAISVLHRKLHESKTFDDFFNSWMPPKESMRPWIHNLLPTF